MFLLLSDYNCQLGSHLSCITTPISHKSTLIPSCSWGHIPRVTLLHLVSHYRKWDIQLDGLCNNGTQRTHFKLKSWVHERHGKGGQSSIIIRDSILLSLSLSLFLKQMLFLRLMKLNFLILIDQESFFWILCRKWNVQMTVCSMRIRNIAHNESHVYTRHVKQSINATGNNMTKTVNQVSQDELYAYHCVIQAYNNVNPG